MAAAVAYSRSMIWIRLWKPCMKSSGREKVSPTRFLMATTGYWRTDQYAHYSRYNEIYEGRYYKKTDTPKSGPTGKRHEVNWNAVYDMRPNPKMKDYPKGSERWKKTYEFNRNYMSVLNDLIAPNGEPKQLLTAVVAMYDVKYQAVELMKVPVDENGLTAQAMGAAGLSWWRRPRARDEADEAAAAAAPASFTGASAWTALPPVASIGSATRSRASAEPGRQALVVVDGRELLLVAVHPEVADARVGQQAQEAVDHARARRAGRRTITISSTRRRAVRGLERRLDGVSRSAQVARAPRSASRSRGLPSAPRNSPGVSPGRAGRTRRSASDGVVDDGQPRMHARDPRRSCDAARRLASVAPPRRNVELKARRPAIPSRTLSARPPLGAEDRGMLASATRTSPPPTAG